MSKQAIEASSLGAEMRGTASKREVLNTAKPYSQEIGRAGTSKDPFSASKTLPASKFSLPWSRHALLGVGGAGVNTVCRLIDAELKGLQYLAIDTSAQGLNRLPAKCKAHRLLLDAARGFGCGGDLEMGREAAAQAQDEIQSHLGEVDLVFLVGGLAGGTGGGSMPKIAHDLRASGAVVIAFGIMPFHFESKSRLAAAETALAELRQTCNTCITLDNERILGQGAESASFDIAMRIADENIRQTVHGLLSASRKQGWIPLDLPILRDVLSQGADALIAQGFGYSTPESRPYADRDGAESDAPPTAAQNAMQSALASPLANMSALRNASRVVVSFVGGRDLSPWDVDAALAALQSHLPRDAELVVGASLDPALKGAAQVMLLGLGLAGPARMKNSGHRMYATGLGEKSLGQKSLFKVRQSIAQDQAAQTASVDTDSILESSPLLSPVRQVG